MSKKIISRPRALEMAKNVFVKGEWKKYREEVRIFQKEKSKPLPGEDDLEKEIAQLRNRLKLENEHEQFVLFFQINNQLKLLEKQKAELDAEKEEREKTFEKRQAELDAKKERLEKICNTPESRKQIAKIALGILKKNVGYVERHSEVKKQREIFENRIKHTADSISTIKNLMMHERAISPEKRPVFTFKMRSLLSQNMIERDGSVGLLSTMIGIAAAGGDVKVAQLVAYSVPNAFDIDGLQATMSDDAKKESERKALARSI